jgi:membrane protease YdiL (CAAX protease family)
MNSQIIKISALLKNHVALTAVFTASAAFWLVSSIGAPLRFTLDPLSVTPWHLLALGLEAAVSLAIVALRLDRKLLFFPVFFSLYPLSYLLMERIDILILGTDYGVLRHKITSDTLFFILEIVCFLPLYAMVPRKNPFVVHGVPADRGAALTGSVRLRRRIVLVLFAMHLPVLGYLTLRRANLFGIPADLQWSLLGTQFLFAVFLGLKEELGFRWLLMQGLERSTGSAIAALVLQAVPWALYHLFFGEGTGTGLPATAITFIGALWFGWLVYEFKTVWLAMVSHTAVEFLGFYLMYGRIIAERL